MRLVPFLFPFFGNNFGRKVTNFIVARLSFSAKKQGGEGGGFPVCSPLKRVNSIRYACTFDERTVSAGDWLKVGALRPTDGAESSNFEFNFPQRPTHTSFISSIVSHSGAGMHDHVYPRSASCMHFHTQVGQQQKYAAAPPSHLTGESC